MPLSLRSAHLQNAFGLTLIATLPLKLAGAIALMLATREWLWGVSWICTAIGSALMFSSAAAIIDLAASSFPRTMARVVRLCGGVGFGLGWLFSVAGGAIISFHPVMLIYILLFGGAGLIVGLGFGVAAGALVALGARPRANR